MTNNIDTDAYLSKLHEDYYEVRPSVEPKDPDIDVEAMRSEEFNDD